MTPPIFDIIDIPAVRALLRGPDGLTRFYLFGLAPQAPTYPYAVWRQIGGQPENYLGDLPDIDNYVVQIDVYAKDVQSAQIARNVAKALRDALEPVSHITRWGGESRDPETKSYVITFDVDFWTPR